MAEMTPITPDMQPVAQLAPLEEPAPTTNWAPAGIIAIIALVLLALALAIILQDGAFLANA